MAAAGCLPIDEGPVFRVGDDRVLIRLTNLVHELVLVDGDAWTRLRGQQAMAIAQRRKGDCLQIECSWSPSSRARNLGTDRIGNLQTRRQRAEPQRIVWRPRREVGPVMPAGSQRSKKGC